MIKIIGLGLWNEKSMSIEAMEEANDCDVLYAEFYTSRLIGLRSKEELVKVLGKDIKFLRREEVEVSQKFILDRAKKEKVGFLVAGDALTATTHIDLVIEAKKRGIEVKIIHGSSIYTAAAGLAGLQIYKFGRSCSIPYPQPGFKVESPFEVIAGNLKQGLHTLVFLDIQPDKLMTANEAMQILLEIGKKKKSRILDNKEIVVVARAGSDEAVVKYGKIKDLIEMNFGEPMHIIIVPGKLHFKEKEYLEFCR
ncbi:TPA: diphthine synthase [archaeon]|nr:diphthine synthase [Candidatus Naiadarchaeales archaeon SRR2090159.bin1288]